VARLRSLESRFTLGYRFALASLRHDAANAAYRPALRADQIKQNFLNARKKIRSVEIAVTNLARASRSAF
jgi:hypothetical protein